ncbi:MAG: small multi-drug export protein [Treponema sp.]|nr:small multi-drug export protein [Treponema sp.]
MPISELRGAIPFAAANGIPLFLAFLFASACNVMIAPACWFFLATLHRHLYGEGAGKGVLWYKNLFDRFVERARKKLSPSLEKWGWLGITVFVGIPLPFTGAWTGTLGAWVLGVSKRRTMLAVVMGVFAAGIIVSAVTAMGIKAFDIFINKSWSQRP